MIDMHDAVENLPPEAFESSTDPPKSTDMSRSSSVRNLRSHSSSYSKLPSGMATGSTSRSYLGREEGSVQTWIDPHRVKRWTRLLGVLLYSCDLAACYQSLLASILGAVIQQEGCIAAIDNVIDNEVTVYSFVFQAKRQQSAQSVLQFLQSTISDTSNVISNCTAFYLQLAHERESHQTQVETLRKLTQDELSHCLELSRDELLDIEAKYDEACQYVLF